LDFGERELFERQAVDVTHAAILVILNAVHRISAEAQSGNGRAMGSAQIMRRDFVLDPERLADIAHCPSSLSIALPASLVNANPGSGSISAMMSSTGLGNHTR